MSSGDLRRQRFPSLGELMKGVGEESDHCGLHNVFYHE